VEVEVWSDLVCPWCFLGDHNLRAAIGQLTDPTGVRVVHRAFQLHPEAPTVGPRLVDVIAEEEDITVEQASDAVSDVADDAAAVGLHYRMSEIVTGNTLDTHRSILWAADQGRGEELKGLIFSAYFEQARPIFTAEQLAPLMRRAGCDPLSGERMLASADYREQVIEDERRARQLGAPGVPFFVFGNGRRLFGAQSPVALSAALADSSAAR